MQTYAPFRRLLDLRALAARCIIHSSSSLPHAVSDFNVYFSRLQDWLPLCFPRFVKDVFTVGYCTDGGQWSSRDGSTVATRKTHSGSRPTSAFRAHSFYMAFTGGIGTAAYCQSGIFPGTSNRWRDGVKVILVEFSASSIRVQHPSLPRDPPNKARMAGENGDAVECGGVRWSIWWREWGFAGAWGPYTRRKRRPCIARERVCIGMRIPDFAALRAQWDLIACWNRYKYVSCPASTDVVNGGFGDHVAERWCTEKED